MPMAETAMSMSLIPMKGTMSPPRPKTNRFFLSSAEAVVAFMARYRLAGADGVLGPEQVMRERSRFALLDDGRIVLAHGREGRDGVLAGRAVGADGALDDVGVDFDAAVIEEQRQPGPAGERVADRIGKLAFGAGLTEPRFEVDV